ncbi:MAG: tRNA-dihydrouridine synthase family protein [Clostridia bacterium]|nr:tRNA-dihydrouridine synthase family protein [Clostridia bacterium]
MRLKSLTIGNLQTENNIFLAPLAGYTDYAFRSLALSLNFSMCFTELVSAKGIVYGGKDNIVLTKTDDYEKTAVQIFGSDPYYMRKALENELLKDYKIADINMGCPVPKVFKNGEGSALLTDIKKAESIIRECVKSGKIITVKIRTGIKSGDDVAGDFAKMAENSGAAMITIHGRVRDAYYSGEPDYQAIYKAKKSVNIPVIANGGLFTVDDADKMMENTGADGVMFARGGIANPFIAQKIMGITPKFTIKDFMVLQIEKMKEIYPDRRAALEFRKFVPYYFKGVDGAKSIKMALFSAENTFELEKIINSI